VFYYILFFTQRKKFKKPKIIFLKKRQLNTRCAKLRKKYQIQTKTKSKAIKSYKKRKEKEKSRPNL
jgi:hypothetical protein